MRRFKGWQVGYNEMASLDEFVVTERFPVSADLKVVLWMNWINAQLPMPNYEIRYDDKTVAIYCKAPSDCKVELLPDHQAKGWQIVFEP